MGLQRPGVVCRIKPPHIILRHTPLPETTERSCMPLSIDTAETLHTSVGTVHPVVHRPVETIWQTLHVGNIRVAKRSEEHTSELQSRGHLVCRLLLEKKNEK